MTIRGTEVPGAVGGAARSRGTEVPRAVGGAASSRGTEVLVATGRRRGRPPSMEGRRTGRQRPNGWRGPPRRQSARGPDDHQGRGTGQRGQRRRRRRRSCRRPNTRPGRTGNKRVTWPPHHQKSGKGTRAATAGPGPCPKARRPGSDGRCGGARRPRERPPAQARSVYDSWDRGAGGCGRGSQKPRDGGAVSCGQGGWQLWDRGSTGRGQDGNPTWDIGTGATGGVICESRIQNSS